MSVSKYRCIGKKSSILLRFQGKRLKTNIENKIITAYAITKRKISNIWYFLVKCSVGAVVFFFFFEKYCLFVSKSGIFIFLGNIRM